MLPICFRIMSLKIMVSYEFSFNHRLVPSFSLVVHFELEASFFNVDLTVY